MLHVMNSRGLVHTSDFCTGRCVIAAVGTGTRGERYLFGGRRADDAAAWDVVTGVSYRRPGTPSVHEGPLVSVSCLDSGGLTVTVSGCFVFVGFVGVPVCPLSSFLLGIFQITLLYGFFHGGHFHTDEIPSGRAAAAVRGGL